MQQEGITQVCIGQVDERHVIHWLTDCPPELIDHLSSGQTLQQVMLTQEIFTFRNHEELVSGGFFPLLRNHRVVGILGLLSNQTDYFKPGTITWIKALSVMISDSLFDRKETPDEKKIEYHSSGICGRV